MDLPEINEIKRTRKHLDMTQTELARASGVSQSLIAKIESGRIDPAYSKIKAIFSALDRKASFDPQARKITARELMTQRVLSLSKSDRLEKALKLMTEHDVSQIPVLDQGVCIGSVSEDRISELVDSGRKTAQMLVGEAMEDGFPAVPENADLRAVAGMLKHYKAVLVGKNGKIIGIITKFDIMKAVER